MERRRRRGRRRAVCKGYLLSVLGASKQRIVRCRQNASEPSRTPDLRYDSNVRTPYSIFQLKQHSDQL